MTDRAALLAAVLAAPDDDLPRLVFADFLDEAGDTARAEFIRVEVAAARLPFDHPDRDSLDRRANRLHDAHAAEWDVELPGWVAAECVVGYRRGFAEDVTVSAARFAADGTDLLAAAPVTTLRLTLPLPPPPAVPFGVFGMKPGLERLSTLDFGPGLLTPTEAGVHPWFDAPTLLDDLLSSPNLTGVRRLRLAGNALRDAGAALIARRLGSAAFAGVLEELDVSDNFLTDAGAFSLSAARGLPALRAVGLAGNAVSLTGMAAVQSRTV